jgi:hypothetical protein
MTEEIRSPLNVLAACARIQTELPGLFGDDWPGVEPEFRDKLAKLQASTDQREQRILAAGLVTLIARNRQANQRLKAELAQQELLKSDLRSDLADLRSGLNVDDHGLQASLDTAALGMHWTLDPDSVEALSEDDITTKSVSMKPGGIGGGKSIKFRNLNLDFGELSAIAGGAMLAGHEVIKEPNGFVIAAGVLMTIAALIKAATVQISEQDASVFWGFIQARDKADNTANDAKILTSTNSQRAKYHRPPLKAEDVLQSLSNLESLKSIARVEEHPGRWKLIERYTVKR